LMGSDSMVKIVKIRIKWKNILFFLFLIIGLIIIFSIFHLNFDDKKNKLDNKLDIQFDKSYQYTN